MMGKGDCVPMTSPPNDELKTFLEAPILASELEWKIVMMERYSTAKNQLQDLVALPHGCMAIGKKWVLLVNIKVDSLVYKYNDRFVAKGFT